MKELISDLRGHFVEWAYFWYLARWIFAGYLWDIVRLVGLAYCCTPGADPAGSIGRQRLKGLILQGTQYVKIPWRDIDTAWSGLSILARWYLEGFWVERKLRQLEAALQPLLAKNEILGNDPVEQMENLKRLLELAEIGQAALADPEWERYRTPQSKDDPEAHSVR